MSSHYASAFLSSLDDTNSSGKRVISYAANQSVRPYSTNQEYLYAMREDLADWLKGLYAVDIDAVNFFDILDTGTLLCQHANNITACAEYMRKNKKTHHWKTKITFPTKTLNYNQGRYVRASSFFARDNIASFIGWCRSELEISDAVMFETNDLVLRYNEKNVILCLLEVARRGSKFGVPAPVLVQMEEEIDEEIELEKVAKERNEVPPPRPKKQKANCDFKSLDEMVQYILGMCTCPTQFRMVKVSDGKYKVGDSENLIFMRILRQHVMVRVGGGWDTLENYLNKHDPCRCPKHKTDRTHTSRHSRSQSAAATPVQPPPPHHQRSLTSTETSLKSTPPSSSRLAASGRMTRSTTNLTELSHNGKSVKNRLSERRSSSQSKTATDLSSDKRVSSSRHSQSTERNMTRNSTSNKTERLSLQPDVFNRLSRPKSTPPISRPVSILPVDQLVVQRSKKGSHQVQRASTPRTLQETRERSRTISSEKKNYLRSKSSASISLSKRHEELSSTKTSRQRQSLNTKQGRQPSKTSTTRASRTRSKSATREIEARERDLLQLFEKECINNRYTLQHDQLKSVPRQASVDSSLDSQRLLSTTSSEDNEVALHMQAFGGAEPKPSRPPPSSYSSLSLPRPRKDKREQHDRRTRIPTPVSFNKPLHHSKSVEHNEESREQDKAINSTPNEPPLQHSQKPKQNNHHVITNNPTIEAPPASRDIRQPRTVLPLDKINQLLTLGQFNLESEETFNDKSTRNDSVSHQLDSTSLRSSGHYGGGNHYSSSSSFTPIENRSNTKTGDVPPITDEVFSSTFSHQLRPRYADNQSGNQRHYDPQVPVNGSANNHASDYSIEAPVNSRLPGHILKTCGLTSTPYFKSEGEHSDLPVQPTSSGKSREPQWV